MAILDERNRVVVLRIVYAGPPLSGKTETVRSLCSQLRSSRQPGEVYTPDEAGARTLFFDWLEYAGGTFHGRTIRCQIVAVPGQSMLYRRRQLLLQSADAVVFVVDSRPEHAEAISASYQEMRRFIEKPDDSSPVGVIVQANKSDLPDAMSKEALQELLATGPEISIVPTVATEGTGLRETFVQAVGIALERVRTLMDAGQLSPPAGPVSIETGEELLQQIKALEDAELGEVQRVVVEILNTIDMPLPEAGESEAEEAALRGPEAQLSSPVLSQQLQDLPPEEDFAQPLPPPPPEPATEPALPFGSEAAPAAEAEEALGFSTDTALALGTEPAPADPAEPPLPFGTEAAPANAEEPALPFGSDPAMAAAADAAPSFDAAAEPAPAAAEAPALPSSTESAPVGAEEPAPAPATEAEAAAALSAAAMEDKSTEAAAPQEEPIAATEAPAASAPQGAAGGFVAAALLVQPPQGTWPVQEAVDAAPAAATPANDVPKDAWATVATPQADGSGAPALPTERSAQPADLPKDAWAAVAAPAIEASFAPVLATEPAPPAAEPPPGSWGAAGTPDINVTGAPAAAAPAEPVTVHPPKDAWVAVHALPAQRADTGTSPAAPGPVTVYPPRGSWAAVHAHPPRGAWAAVEPGDALGKGAPPGPPRLSTSIYLPQSAAAAVQAPPAAPKKLEGVAASFELVPEPEAAHNPAPERQAAAQAAKGPAPQAIQQANPQDNPQGTASKSPRPTQPPQAAPAPVTPDKRVGAGMVWPPIAGRHVLNALSGGQPRLRQLPNQAWAGESGRWLLLSLPEHAFSSEVLAREEMLRLSRSHSILKPVLTEQRCVSCTQNRGNEWRIWQVVRRETTLADVLQLMHGLPTAESIVTELLRIAYLLGVALARFRAASLFCAPTLDKIAVSQGGPVYSGFVLPADTTSNGHSENLGAAGLIRRELQGAITALARRLELMPQLLRQLEANKRSAPPGDRVAETLIAMFLHTDTRT